MNRRGFLGAMLAACAAPAVVKAESLMKIVVPKQDIILPPELGKGDITIESWLQDPTRDGRWHHVAVISEHGVTKTYVDGIITARHDILTPFKDLVLPMAVTHQLPRETTFTGRLDDLRVTSLARPVEALGHKQGAPKTGFSFSNWLGAA